MEIHLVRQSGTHKYTLYLILIILQTPRQMEINLVHQSGTQTHIHSLFNTLVNTDATTDEDKSCTSARYTPAHRYTLSSKLMIIQTPRQMEINLEHQSGTHTHTLSLIL